ncbi:sphingolipid delta(4)-desaturase DES1 [Trichonephila inaurata madagascariensis]|uniref:Sphingolipid delta(4)-desaturase DES1 n=1 Tax=Trichonephila inaurata madagascariensis TaxID=2747483 RepID=A0A8X7C5N9_9ARAC|nr:sphingolipid delta(4)-desaturase DES1 [Trichonephila inaurata madagascariensis]
MGAKVSRSDFEWVYTDEPHATRRKEILKKYPEIKNLMGYDPNFKYVVVGMVLVQLISFWLLKDASFTILCIAAYCFGGVINHSLGLAIHEISHNLAFGHAKPMYNRIFGMFANLPIGIPMSISFKKYHLEHHRYQGDERLDTDLPTRLEAKLFCTTFTKFLWVLLQPFFYTLRAFFVYPKPPTTLEIINLIVQIAFDALVWYFCGELADVDLLRCQDATPRYSQDNGRGRVPFKSGRKSSSEESFVCVLNFGGSASPCLEHPLLSYRVDSATVPSYIKVLKGREGGAWKYFSVNLS